MVYGKLLTDDGVRYNVYVVRYTVCGKVLPEGTQKAVYCKRCTVNN